MTAVLSEEAHKMWCPHTEHGDCISAGCMMWRWAQKPNPDWKPQNSMSMSLGYPIDTRNDPPMYIDDTSRGYCGLAGRP